MPFRIIQDPESLRALSQRDGSAWEAWSQLKHDLLIQLNSSDHNPAVTPGWSPSSEPELNTPWFLQYYVKGGPDDSACVGGGVGPATGCQHGYILSDANWDPFPIDNQIEANPPRMVENAAISMRRVSAAVRAAKQRTTRFRTRRARSTHTYLLVQAYAAAIARKTADRITPREGELQWPRR